MDINYQNKEGATLLMTAADRGHPQGLQYLLDRGADQTLTNAMGETALAIAMREAKRHIHGPVISSQYFDRDFLKAVKLPGGPDINKDDKLKKQ